MAEHPEPRGRTTVDSKTPVLYPGLLPYRQTHPHERITRPADWSRAERREAVDFVAPQTAAWQVPLTARQVHQLVLGFQPQEMEDKWVIYADGPGPKHGADQEHRVEVHFHRSWTGHPIAAVGITVARDGREGAAEHEEGAASSSRPVWRYGYGGGQIAEIVFETSEDRWQGGSEAAARELVGGVARSLLEVDLAKIEAGFAALQAEVGRQKRKKMR